VPFRQRLPCWQRCLILAMGQVGDAWRATPKGRGIALWVARARQDRRRRWSWKAASVTPCRPAGGRRCSMSTATSVLGGSPPASAARSWAPTRSRCPGRGNGTPAPPALGLGDPPPAAGQVEQGHAHPPATPRSRLAQPGRARLGAGGCGALPQPEVRHPPGVLVGDALASPTTRSRPGRGRRRRSPAWPPDAGLMDAAAMARSARRTQPDPAPAPRPALPGPRYPACGLGLPGLLTIELQGAVGAPCPPDTSTPAVSVTTASGDDPRSTPATDPVQVMVLDGDSGGDASHNRPSATTMPARICSGGAGQPHPERRLAAATGAAPAGRRSGTRRARNRPGPGRACAAGSRRPAGRPGGDGGLEPGAGGALEHRPSPVTDSSPNVPRWSLLAECLIVADRGPASSLPCRLVSNSHAPHPGRPQQPRSGWPAGGCNPGEPWRFDAPGESTSGDHAEQMFSAAG